MIILTDITAAAILIITMLMLATAIVNLFFRVPFVPSKMTSIKRMIEIADLKSDEIIYDLGCGDGRLLIEAKKTQNVQARGFEVAPIPFLLAGIKKWLINREIRLYFSNFLKADLSDADVIFCYLGSKAMSQLYQKIKKECRKGTRVVSNTFRILEMKPVKTRPKDILQKIPTIYLYEI